MINHKTIGCIKLGIPLASLLFLGGCDSESDTVNARVSSLLASSNQDSSFALAENMTIKECVKNLGTDTYISTLAGGLLEICSTESDKKLKGSVAIGGNTSTVASGNTSKNTRGNAVLPIKISPQEKDNFIASVVGGAAGLIAELTKEPEIITYKKNRALSTPDEIKNNYIVDSNKPLVKIAENTYYRSELPLDNPVVLPAPVYTTQIEEKPNGSTETLFKVSIDPSVYALNGKIIEQDNLR